MIIDHIGLILLPEYKVLRIIGRIALPLYAFLIAFSFTKTSDPFMYFIKFLLMFLVIQIPTTWYLFLNNNNLYVSPFYINIFANLTLGAGFILIYKKNKIGSLIYFLLIGSLLIFIENNNLYIKNDQTNRISIDYGIFGFLLIVGFWMFFEIHALLNKNTKNKTIFLHWLKNILSACWLIIILLINEFALIKINAIPRSENLKNIQLWSLVVVPLILLFSQHKLIINKMVGHIFWFSYPLTIAITYFIAQII